MFIINNIKNSPGAQVIIVDGGPPPGDNSSSNLRWILRLLPMPFTALLSLVTGGLL